MGALELKTGSVGKPWFVLYLYMRNFLVLGLFLLSGPIFGQSRYFNEIFTAVDSTTNVVYGQNLSWNNQNTTLALDVYQPQGDTLGVRPLMVFVHGGSFTGGVRNDPFMRELCISFARRGFVTATVSYRLGVDLNNLTTLNQEFMKATLRSMQDVKAALRFFRKSVAENGNPYRIDTSRILLGGYSAGAISSIHSLLLTDTTLASPVLRQLINQLGGLEGNSGNPGYSSSAKALFSLAGAVLDTALVTGGAVPSLHIHGTADQTVPYGRGFASANGFPVIEVFGSSLLHARLQNTGAISTLSTLQQVGHDLVTNPNTREAVKFSLALFAYSFMIDALAVNEQKLSGIRLYPNPTRDEFTLEGAPEGSTLELYTLQGKLVHTQTIGSYEQLNSRLWPAGLYVVRITHQTRSTTQRLVIRQ